MKCRSPSSASHSLPTRFLKWIAATWRIAMSTVSCTIVCSKMTRWPGAYWNCTRRAKNERCQWVLLPDSARSSSIYQGAMKNHLSNPKALCRDLRHQTDSLYPACMIVHALMGKEIFASYNHHKHPGHPCNCLSGP